MKRSDKWILNCLNQKTIPTPPLLNSDKNDIDHCITNKGGFRHVKEVIIRDEILGSDHCPIEVVLEFSEFENGK